MARSHDQLSVVVSHQARVGSFEVSSLQDLVAKALRRLRKDHSLPVEALDQAVALNALHSVAERKSRDGRPGQPSGRQDPPHEPLRGHGPGDIVDQDILAALQGLEPGVDGPLPGLPARANDDWLLRPEGLSLPSSRLQPRGRPHHDDAADLVHGQEQTHRARQRGPAVELHQSLAAFAQSRTRPSSSHDGSDLPLPPREVPDLAVTPSMPASFTVHWAAPARPGLEPERPRRSPPRGSRPPPAPSRQEPQRPLERRPPGRSPDGQPPAGAAPAGPRVAPRPRGLSPR